jgi:hypothetical protein
MTFLDFSYTDRFGQLAGEKSINLNLAKKPPVLQIYESNKIDQAVQFKLLNTRVVLRSK